MFSVTSFHGRGFFAEILAFDRWIVRLAALEAIVRLLVEVSFIATFTQRFLQRQVADRYLKEAKRPIAAHYPAPADCVAAMMCGPAAPSIHHPVLAKTRGAFVRI